MGSDKGGKSLKSYLDLQTLSEYLSYTRLEVKQGAYYYDFGRTYAVSYGWKTISENPRTLIFGMGLGARGESKTLGTAGEGLLRGNLGITSGTSLLVII